MSEIKIESTIEKVKDCARSVFDELGPGWQEKVYQVAMEVAFRLEGITYEAQKIIPIDYKGYTVAQSALDLVVWTDEKPSTGIVVDLKTESCVKEEFDLQVKRYIKKLRELEDERSEQNRRNIYNKGMVIAFSKASTKQIVCDEEEGVYFAFVDEHENPELKGRKKKEE